MANKILTEGKTPPISTPVSPPKQSKIPHVGIYTNGVTAQTAPPPSPPKTIVFITIEQPKLIRNIRV